MMRRSVFWLQGWALAGAFFVGGALPAYGQDPAVETIPSEAQGALAPSPQATPTAAAEDWKGEPYLSQVMLSALSGLALIDNHTTFTILGAAAKKILDRGFVKGINDSVWGEAEIGPAFYGGSAGLVYSVHLRWDFNKDPNWTFYALAGFSGNVLPMNLGGRNEFFPRFGLGALFHLVENLSIRAELSHELMVAGAQFEF